MSYPLKKRVVNHFTGFPRAYWYLWGGTLLNRLGMFVIPFFTIYLTAVRHISISRAALIASLLGVGSFGASLVGGMLADRIGRRTTMVIGLFLAAATTLTLSFIQSLVGLAVLTIFLGLCADLYRPASAAAVADIVQPDQRIRAYGLLYWATNIGAAIAPIIAGIVATTSYFTLFIADAVTTLGFGILVLLGIPETRPYRERHTAARFKNSGVRIALTDLLLLSYTILAFLFACIYFQSMVTLPIDMYAHGVSTALYGVAIATNGLVIVGFSIPINQILSRFPHHFILASAALLMGIGFGLVGLVHSAPLYILTVIIWTFGELIASPVAATAITDLSPVHLRGIYQGIYGTAWGLAAFVGPAVGGFVLQHFGTHILWSGCFVLGILIACGHLLLARNLRQTTERNRQAKEEEYITVKKVKHAQSR